MTRLAIGTFAALLLLSTGPVLADDPGSAEEKVPNDGGGVLAQPTFCPLDVYKGEKQNVLQPIPDNDPAGIQVGPIVFPPQPGFVIVDVVVDLEINHTWVGDLLLTLTHVGGNGVSKQVDLLNRPGVPQTSFGCAGDLTKELMPGETDNKYYFGLGGGKPLGEFDCPSVFPHGCYTEAIDSGAPMIIFRDQPKDGEWFLQISDNAAGDFGTICNWSVHLLCEGPVSVEPATWTSIKGGYR